MHTKNMIVYAEDFWKRDKKLLAVVAFGKENWWLEDGIHFPQLSVYAVGLYMYIVAIWT